MYPFEFSVSRASSSALQATVRLDPHQPYLNDHRPHDSPLLGTAVGIAIFQLAATILAPRMCIRAIESFENHAAFILGDETDPVVELAASLEAPADGRCMMACELISRSAQGEPALHFRARLHVDRRRAAAPAHMRPPPAPRNEVPAEDIYALFFHGPAFRVIGAAGRHDERLLTRLAENLPPLFAWPSGAGTVSQWVELAMQSAGLFEVAVNGRMMIPHRIQRLELHCDEPASQSPLWAVAARSRRPDSLATDLDVAVIDPAGRAHLSLFGYRTRPLPFPFDPVALAALHARFA